MKKFMVIILKMAAVAIVIAAFTFFVYPEIAAYCMVAVIALIVIGAIMHIIR